MTDALDRIITADDLIRGGACRRGVMKSASDKWPAAFSVRAALAESKRRRQPKTVVKALDIDGYVDGYGYVDGGDGYGYVDGYGYGGFGDGYGSGGYGDGGG